MLSPELPKKQGERKIQLTQEEEQEVSTHGNIHFLNIQNSLHSYYLLVQILLFRGNGFWIRLVIMLPLTGSQLQI